MDHLCLALARQGYHAHSKASPCGVLNTVMRLQGVLPALSVRDTERCSSRRTVRLTWALFEEDCTDNSVIAICPACGMNARMRQVQRDGLRITVDWPVHASAACTAWLRELTRS